MIEEQLFINKNYLIKDIIKELHLKQIFNETPNLLLDLKYRNENLLELIFIVDETIQESDNESSSSKSKKAPKIDFNKQSYLEPKLPLLDHSESDNQDRDIFIERQVLKTLSEQYALISSILGFDSFEDTYDFKILQLANNTSGYHLKPSELKKGEIALNKSKFDKLCSLMRKASNESEEDSIAKTLPYLRSFFLVELVRTLAHELYHKRQANFYPNFYRRRNNNSISPDEDFDAYQRQLIEVGANAFAKKYIEHLIENILNIEDTLLSTSLKTYATFKDYIEQIDNSSINNS